MSDINEPYQVYNLDANTVEGYFDNELEAEAKANEFKNATVYDLRMNRNKHAWNY